MEFADSESDSKDEIGERIPPKQVLEEPPKKRRKRLDLVQMGSVLTAALTAAGLGSSNRHISKQMGVGESTICAIRKRYREFVSIEEMSQSLLHPFFEPFLKYRLNCRGQGTWVSDLGSRVTSNRRTDRLCLWVEMTHLNSQVVHHTHGCGGFEQRVWQPLKVGELANPLYNIGFWRRTSIGYCSTACSTARAGSSRYCRTLCLSVI